MNKQRRGFLRLCFNDGVCLGVSLLFLNALPMSAMLGIEAQQV